MKKSILISILILMTFLKLASEVTFNSDFHEYNDDHRLNYILKYNKNIGDYNLNFTNKLQKSNNKVFDQINSINEFNTRLSTSKNRLTRGLLLTYKRKYDHYPQYQLQGDITNDHFLTGYYLNLALTDSLTTAFRSEYAYSKEKNPNIGSQDFSNKGFISNINTNYGLEIIDNYFRMNLQYDNDNRSRNYKNSLNTILNHTLNNGYIYFNNQVMYQTAQDDIYKLVNMEYKQTDTHNKDNFQFVSQIANTNGDKFSAFIESMFNKNSNRLKNSSNKTNRDQTYNISTNFAYQVFDNLSLFMENYYNYSTKNFSQSTNNRESDTRKVLLGARISTPWLDSLSVSQSVEMVSTDFPKADHGFDNDYITEISRVTIKKLFSDNVRLNNNFVYSKIQEVYLNSKYSASNNIKTSYSLYPNLDILLGDNLLISQFYSIRIDYDDYVYDSLTNFDASYTLYDRFYRQVSAEYKLRYDNAPVRITLNRNDWKQPDNLKIYRDNFNIVLGYKYFANETGNKRSNIYDINNSNTKHEIILFAEKNYGALNLSIKPSAVWGDSRIYELISSFNYQQTENTNLVISFNPKYDVNKEEYVYTIDTLIGVRF